MKYLTCTLIIFYFTSLYGQNSVRIYKVESKTFEINKKYAIQELLIYSDSTYSHRNYKLNDKSQNSDYRYLNPIVTNGTFRKEGDFYYLKPNNENFEIGRYKINDKYVSYYYDMKNGKIKKGAKYKRVKKTDLSDIAIIQDIKEYKYFRSIDKELKSSIHKGTIEYGQNFSKNGKFECYRYYYPENDELIRIEYLETTDIHLTENYYYRNGLLIYAERMNEYKNIENKKKTVYLNNGFIIHESKTDIVSSEYLIEKGNRYINEYKASR